MNFMFVKEKDCDLEQYKKDMQEAFQKGFEEEFGKTEEVILPREDIDKSLQTKGAIAYKAVVECLIKTIIDEGIMKSYDISE